VVARTDFAVAVFCGSSVGRDPQHAAAARVVGAGIAARGWTLVYGGGQVGLMGILADAALELGGNVIGVIPRFLRTREVAHEGLTRLEVVDTLAERKQRMGDLANAFLSLPGGIGTLDELFEAVSWSQVGMQRKPNALLNVAGFYDSLLIHLDRAAAEGYIRPAHRALLTVGSESAALLDALYELAIPTSATPGEPHGRP
jgi:uncharacterized protein (TIGR00730 family)